MVRESVSRASFSHVHVCCNVFVAFGSWSITSERLDNPSRKPSQNCEGELTIHGN